MLTEHFTNRGGSSLVRVRCGDGEAGEERLSILQKKCLKSLSYSHILICRPTGGISDNLK